MKKSKQYFLLPLDLETTGFNGIQEVDGKLVNGADYFDIMQIAYQIVDPVDMMPYISNDYFIDVSDEGIARMNPSTREFHDTVHEGARCSFKDLYHTAHRVPYAAAEAAIINALKEVLAVNGHVLEHYKYGQSYEIVLLGKSCQFDRDFLRAKMPNLSRYLSHRSFDVSVFVLPTQMWTDMTYLQPAQASHLADDDCKAAMKDAALIKEYVTLMPSNVEKKDKFFSDRFARFRFPFRIAAWFRNLFD